MDEMANAAEMIEKKTREAEQLRILMIVQDLKAKGEDIDAVIAALKAMVGAEK